MPRFGPSWARTQTPGYIPPASGAAAPGGAAAAPTGETALPVDPSYLAAYNAATSRRDTSLAGLAQQRSSGLSDYGFNEGSYDPSAAGFGALTVDPNNPFSKAALLKQTYDRSRRATGQTMAAGGGLYAGSYQNAQDAVNRGQLGAEDTLQKSLERFLAQNTRSYAQAGTDFNNTVAGAQADSISRFTSNPNYNPSPQQTAAAAPAADNTVTRKSAAQGGKLWRYRVGASGKLIPVGPA